MKTLLSGSNQLTLEDNHTYDLVIPDDIDKLGTGCTSEIPNKIRNMIVPNNQTQGEDDYPLDNLTTSNVVYSGSDTKAPWGAKSLNGVDATYTPMIMGGFDIVELPISNDQSDTPIEFKLCMGNISPTIMQEKINTCLLDSIIAKLDSIDGTDVTSEVLNCIEFSSQPVYDSTWNCYTYEFTTKPGSELAAAINGKELYITAILKDPTDASKTYTWSYSILTLYQEAPAPVLPGDPLNTTLQHIMNDNADYDTANVTIDNSCNYLIISVSTNTPIYTASINDKQNINNRIDGVITGDNNNIITFTIPTTGFISGGISSIAFEIGLSGFNLDPVEGPLIEATQQQIYDPTNYFEMDLYDNGEALTGSTQIETPISTGIKVTLYADSVSAITGASCTDYDYTETINGTIDSVNNTVVFNLSTSMYSSSGGCYTMNITINYSGTTPVFNTRRCTWEEVNG